VVRFVDFRGALFVVFFVVRLAAFFGARFAVLRTAFFAFFAVFLPRFPAFFAVLRAFFLDFFAGADAESDADPITSFSISSGQPFVTWCLLG